MKEYEANYIVMTEAEVRRLFTNAKGLTRSDKRKEKEGQPESKPIEPNHPEPGPAPITDVRALRKFILQ